MIESNDIMVSVLCQTYNHEKYIAECLQSLVSQKVSFRYEILVHDDASTDNTANLIREFEKEYPDLIKPIYQKENQWSKGNKVFSDIQLPRCIGRYIAICEGDDYWIDPLKLQKQVDFLESHPDYAMCFSKCREQIEVSGIENVFSHLESRDYMGHEVLSKWTIPTATVLFRNYGSYLIFAFPEVVHADIFLFLLLAEKGKLFCMNEMTATYRRNSGGLTQLPQNEKLLKSYLEHYMILDNYFNKKYHSILARQINLVSIRLVKKCFPKPLAIKYFFSCMLSPIVTINNLRNINKLRKQAK